MPRDERRANRAVKLRDRNLADRVTAHSPSAGELAWLVLQVCAAAEQTKELGWCVGALRPENLSEQGTVLQRSGRESACSAIRAKIRARAHRKEGHDPWCYEFGISRAHLWRLIRELRPQDGGWLVLEAIEAAWGDLRLGARTSNESPRDCIEYRVRERITPVRWCQPDLGGTVL